MKPPPIQFAPGPDGRVAYQVVGEGPVDLVLVPLADAHGNLDVMWEHPPLERYFRRLASFSRLILCNFRGTALSDPIPDGASPTPEEWMMDLRRVLDAAGSERAALLANESAGGVAMFFAATFPERTHSLAVVNCAATFRREDDYPWGLPPEALNRFMKSLVDNWGTGKNLEFMAPDLAKDTQFREWFARLERLSMNAATLASWARQIESWDVRRILPSIQAPTLAISHTDWFVRPQHGRYLAEHIPNARYVERPGSWGVYWIHDVDWVLDEVQAFLTGVRGAAGLDDRVLATVLFTDIVGSTERAAELGDRRWRELLDDHDSLARREIERFRGRALKFTGDGVLATFDGPARAIRCGLAINEAVRDLGIDIRTGLHTGEVERRGEDVGGIAVHIAARVMAEAGANEVLVSGAVPPLVAGSGIEFSDRGVRELKGVPGEWRIFAVAK